MRIVEYPSLVVNGSMTGNITSVSFPVSQASIASLQAVWTGTPVGALTILISNDDVNYTTYTGSSVSIAGSAGNFLWNLISCGFNFVRVLYTASSSTGTLNVTGSYKGV